MNLRHRASWVAFLAIALCGAAVSGAQDAGAAEAFVAANAAYEEGDYATALSGYEDLLAGGLGGLPALGGARW